MLYINREEHLFVEVQAKIGGEETLISSFCRYAARHSKLSKSVTFNRDTLQSPPNSGNLVGRTSPSLFPLNSPTGNGMDDMKDLRKDDDGKRQDLGKCGIQIISSKANQMKLIKGKEQKEFF